MVFIFVGFLMALAIAMICIKLIVEVLAQIINRVIEIRKNFKKTLAEEKPA